MQTMPSKTRRTRTWLAALVALAAAAIPGSAQVSLRTVVELAQQNSSSVRLAGADIAKARASLSESRDVFMPALAFSSGLPAFPEVGFTGALPTIWGATVQSMVFSVPQYRNIQAARIGLNAALLSQKDAMEQVALDASTDYIELDTVDTELDVARQQESYAARMIAIEQQRAESGVDPLNDLLEAQLTAAEMKLKRLHLETRAATLSEQLSTLTGLPVGSITPDHSSIPEIPAITGDEPPRATAGVQSARLQADSRERAAMGDRERVWFPQISFGAIYNRNTTLLNNTNEYYNHFLPANNFSSGFNIQLPLFDIEGRAKARDSAADALRAKVEAEQAESQNDLQITELTASLRELDAEADVARLKSQIASEQLKTVMTQLEFGNGASGGPGAPPQLSPKAEQQARIDERQKYLDSLDAGFDLSKARLDLLRALGHMQDWLNELHTK
ncbi:MAG TPA: TolC family protein [Terracidiphilus sp.]|jgi:outer membrane protein TolC|nr:TolC family protein [Terracidiphilus sp.]